MTERDFIRLRGFKDLLHDGIRRGTDFVEKHHRTTSEKPFLVLESIRPIAAPSKTVHSIHDGVLSLTYGGIRAINRAAEVADGWIINRLESKTRFSDR